jgi:hypothetical protein
VKGRCGLESKVGRERWETSASDTKNHISLMDEPNVMFFNNNLRLRAVGERKAFAFINFLQYYLYIPYTTVGSIYY